MGKSLDELAIGTIERGKLTAKGMDMALSMAMSCTEITARAYVKMWRAALAILTDKETNAERKVAKRPGRKGGEK